MASESDDAAEAAARLEAALERIAALTAARPPVPDSGDPHDSAVPTEEITARLDALIDRLRDALGTRQD
jgi:hypothetical protein